MIIPRVGDYWMFRPSQGKHTTKKFIKNIYWKPSKITGRMCPWIEWSHTPKARYIGAMRVKFFLGKRDAKLIKRARDFQRPAPRDAGEKVSE